VAFGGITRFVKMSTAWNDEIAGHTDARAHARVYARVYAREHLRDVYVISIFPVLGRKLDKAD